jgi:hypothetical protein
MGAVFWGGAFAQKAVARSSTDEALREVFTAVVFDLNRSWRERQVGAPGDAAGGAEVPEGGR